MIQPIIFYDLKREGSYKDERDMAWSPNTWRTRRVFLLRSWPAYLTFVTDSYVLEYKSIPFETKWVEFAAIDAIMDELGVEPYPPGTAIFGKKYLVPVIYDPNTKRSVMESNKINRYLDVQYPDTPQVFPAGTHALQSAFVAYTHRTLFWTLWPSLLNFIFQTCVESDKPWFRSSREALLSTKLEDLAPTGDARTAALNSLTTILSDVGSWIDTHGPTVVFLGGDAPIHADFDFAAYLLWLLKVAPSDHEMVKLVKSAEAGRWVKYLDAVDGAIRKPRAYGA